MQNLIEKYESDLKELNKLYDSYERRNRIIKDKYASTYENHEVYKINNDSMERILVRITTLKEVVQDLEIHSLVLETN